MLIDRARRRFVLSTMGSVAGVALAPCARAAQARSSLPFKIVTASPRGTYIQIARDLATYVAPDAGLRLEVLPSAGSAENVRRLRYEPGVRLAIVQSDVYQAFLDEAAAGNAEAGAIIKPLRVILPLYNEEVYFIVRADSSLDYVHDIRNARINVGEVGSGTALTTVTLYRLMFGTGIAEANASYLTNEQALGKLLDDKSLDVVAVIAGQPAKLLADMKPEARKLIRLLRFDPTNRTSEAVLRTYFPATVRASSYPNLLDADVPAVAVKAFLTTYDYNLRTLRDALVRFASALCHDLPVLQERGHPKWREVTLALPELGEGWLYFAPALPTLRQCIAESLANGGTSPSRTSSGAGARPCSQQQRVMGLC